MPRFLTQSGAVLNALLGTLALLSVALVAFVTLPRNQLPAGPSAREVRILLSQLGLNPASLTAAGVTANQAGAMVTAARDHLAGAGSGIPAARTACSSLTRQISPLATLASTGRATEQQLTQLASLRAQLATAQAALDSALAQAEMAATAGLSPAQMTVLNTIKSNTGRELPMEFRTVERSDADWVALRDALIQQRVDQEAGVEASQAAQRVQTALGDATVSAAASNLATGAEAVAAAWDAALGAN